MRASSRKRNFKSIGEQEQTERPAASSYRRRPRPVFVKSMRMRQAHKPRAAREFPARHYWARPMGLRHAAYLPSVPCLSTHAERISERGMQVGSTQQEIHQGTGSDVDSRRSKGRDGKPWSESPRRDSSVSFASTLLCERGMRRRKSKVCRSKVTRV